MIRARVASLAVLLTAGVALLSACSQGGTDAPKSADGKADSGASQLNFVGGTAKSNNAPADSGDFSQQTSSRNARQKWVQLSAGKAGNLDPVVINGAGFTLYRFDKDTADPSKSNCNGDCAVTWPPVLISKRGTIFIDGVPKSAVGVVRRDDGNLQVTIGGWPVYRFSKDTQPGDTNGQGVGGTWFGVTPDGQKAGQQAGDSGSTAPAAGTVTLFDDPNFADNGSQQLSGVGCQDVPRPDVASSIKIDGGPVKIWTGPNCTGQSKVVSGEIADLDTIGFDNAIESIRFGVSDTTGAAPAAAPEQAPATQAPAQLGNGTVTLFDDPNFADNGSQQVTGPGCQQVFRTNVASSIKLDGGPVKIWTGSNCTGKSMVISTDIADLAAIGFDNQVASIRFAG